MVGLRVRSDYASYAEYTSFIESISILPSTRSTGSTNRRNTAPWLLPSSQVLEALGAVLLVANASRNTETHLCVPRLIHEYYHNNTQLKETAVLENTKTTLVSFSACEMLWSLSEISSDTKCYATLLDLPCERILVQVYVLTITINNKRQGFNKIRKTTAGNCVEIVI